MMIHDKMADRCWRRVCQDRFRRGHLTLLSLFLSPPLPLTVFLFVDCHSSVSVHLHRLRETRIMSRFWPKSVQMFLHLYVHVEEFGWDGTLVAG